MVEFKNPSFYLARSENTKLFVKPGAFISQMVLTAASLQFKLQSYECLNLAMPVKKRWPLMTRNFDLSVQPGLKQAGCIASYRYYELAKFHQNRKGSRQNVLNIVWFDVKWSIYQTVHTEVGWAVLKSSMRTQNLALYLTTECWFTLFP